MEESSQVRLLKLSMSMGLSQRRNLSMMPMTMITISIMSVYLLLISNTYNITELNIIFLIGSFKYIY